MGRLEPPQRTRTPRDPLPDLVGEDESPAKVDQLARGVETPRTESRLFDRVEEDEADAADGSIAPIVALAWGGACYQIVTRLAGSSQSASDGSTPKAS
jgi:hypothetical protein